MDVRKTIEKEEDVPTCWVGEYWDYFAGDEDQEVVLRAISEVFGKACADNEMC